MRHETVPLRADIRLLGGVLGEVIREQDGQALFDRIEAIRQASVAYHREPSQDRSESLQALLSALDLDQTVRFAHSFASFSQLTNIAEDQARRRVLRHPDACARPDTVSAALEVLQAEGVGRDEVLALVQQMYVAPVLTAHPTEIRRKSIIDRVGAISALLDAIDGAPLAGRARTAEGRAAPPGGHPVEDAPAAPGAAGRERRDRHRRRLCRAHLPARAAEALCGAGSRRWWIRLCRASSGRLLGRRRPRRQSERRRRHACAPPSAARPRPRSPSTSRRSTRSARSCPSPTAWPGSRPRWRRWPNARRTPRPTAGRALPAGAVGRLCAARRHLRSADRRAGRRGRPRPSDRTPYASAAELQADLKTVQASLVEHHGAAFAHGRLPDLIRAVDVLRLPPGHRRHAPELRRARARGGGAAEGRRRSAATTAAWTRRRGWSCCTPSSATAVCCTRPTRAYAEETVEELAVLRAAAEVSGPLRTRRDRHLHHLQDRLASPIFWRSTSC